MYEESGTNQWDCPSFFCFHNAPSETPTVIDYAYKVV